MNGYKNDQKFFGMDQFLNVKTKKHFAPSILVDVSKKELRTVSRIFNFSSRLNETPKI